MAALCENDRQDQFQLSFFFCQSATTQIYTLSLHDALPISMRVLGLAMALPGSVSGAQRNYGYGRMGDRSEEHTSELQSQFHLVCRLLLEKKKKWRSLRRQDSCHSMSGPCENYRQGQFQIS